MKAGRLEKKRGSRKRGEGRTAKNTDMHSQAWWGPKRRQLGQKDKERIGRPTKGKGQRLGKEEKLWQGRENLGRN